MRKGRIYVYFNRAKYEKEGIEKYYVGQTIETMKRRAGTAGRGYGALDENCDYKFARAIKKWGWDAFEGRVLEEVYEEDLDELEKFYIEQFDSYKNGYNTTKGGAGFRGINPLANKTEEEIKNWKYNLKEKCGFYCYCYELNIFFPSCTIATEYCSKYLKIQLSNISAACKRKNNKTGFYKGKELHWNFIESVSEELLQTSKYIGPFELEELLKNKINFDEDKNYIYAVNGKKCYCKELNIYFQSCNIAEIYCKKILRINLKHPSVCCNGYRKSTGALKDGTKLHWKWAKDVDEETLNNAKYINISILNDLIEEYGDYKIEKAVDNKKRKCYCNELDLYFESCNVADDYCRNILGIKIRGCGDVCKGKRKQSGKYNGESLHWNFVDNLYDEYKYIDRKKYNELISKNVNVCK